MAMGRQTTLTKMVSKVMAFLAVDGMTIPLVAGVVGFLKGEMRRPAAFDRSSWHIKLTELRITCCNL